MVYRKTLRQSVTCAGIGLHSGKPVRLTLKPAPASSGIRFLRTDTGTEIPAVVEHLGCLDHATTLSRGQQSVRTVEHVLSALQGLGVDDALVALDADEVPVLDGSAEPFVRLIQQAGLVTHAVHREYLKVLAPVEVVWKDRSVRVSPADHFRVSYTIGFDHPLLQHQTASYRITSDSFQQAIAPARTFGFLKDAGAMRRHGLAQGCSSDNAIVVGDEGLPPLRFEDEFVRHKILDAIGDLALLGYPLVGHVQAIKAGHALHAALACKLLVTPEAWEVVPYPMLRRVPERSVAATQLAFQPS